MTTILGSADWGGPARSLLASLRELEPSLPAFVHMRHTERPAYTPEASDRLASTPGGREASVEFGRGLPADRKYRLSSTRVKRAVETASCIREGLESRGVQAVDSGLLSCRISVDSEALERYLEENLRRSRGEAEAAVNFTNLWCAGLTPPTVTRASDDFAREIADRTRTSLESATPDTVDVYVSHDTWVGCLLWHWFGVPLPADGIRFLDGFLVQPSGDAMTLWLRGSRRRVEYPHWWAAAPSS